MLLSEVGYARPATLEQALGVLADYPGARALAGGQTLVNVMKARAAAPDVLVDLAGIPELKGIELGTSKRMSEVVSEVAELTLPHPRAHERAFVLVPWTDADPRATLRVAAGDGGIRPVVDLLADLDRSGVRPGPRWEHQ